MKVAVYGSCIKIALKIDIDYLALDEYDRVGNQAEDSATESMASSKFKVLRRFSTPKQVWDLVG